MDQLPLDPPVLIGFLVTPVALVPGFAMNLDPWPMPPLGPFPPAFPPFLLFTGNDIFFGFIVKNKAVKVNSFSLFAKHTNG
jgi:hypothetical protein